MASGLSPANPEQGDNYRVSNMQEKPSKPKDSKIKALAN